MPTISVCRISSAQKIKHKTDATLNTVQNHLQHQEEIDTETILRKAE